MSSGPKTRGSFGPTSPRGQYSRSLAAPGLSLDMPDKVVKKAKGGKAESKAMMKKEVAFMKKKGAPKSMIRHEEAEYGMKKGTKKMAGGGMTDSYRKAADGIASRGKTKGKMVKMMKGGYCG